MEFQNIFVRESGSTFIKAFAMGGKKKPLGISGARNIQNTLLVQALENEAGIGQIVFIEQTMPSEPGSSSSHSLSLVLFDCQNTCSRDGNEPWKVMEEPPNEFPFALFNVSPSYPLRPRDANDGLRGVFYDTATTANIARGVQGILEGKLWFPRSILEGWIFKGPQWSEPDSADIPTLTPREKEILVEMSHGLSNDEIAEKLGLSYHTVKTHTYNLFQKLEVNNRLQAVLWASKNL